mmetsp:Transcript_3915/g.7788  ORF Transcript_3915/g.7788 Transcript_3915/m.7788 type:complete len:314 (+) Transcript_3915:129-1070(+)
MSQRRTANSKPAVIEEGAGGVLVKGPLSLEMPTPGSHIMAEEKVPLSTQGSSDLSSTETPRSSRVKNWKESPFAVGLTEPTWEAERKGMNRPKDDDDQPMISDDDYIPRDTTGCLCCSALVCSYLGAGRVGNMAVLHSTIEWVEQVEVDEETNEEKVIRYTRPKLNWVMGPFWPMLLFVTYPLILGVSLWAFNVAILPGNKPSIVVLGWFAITIGLIVALALTGCRDPGILYRHPRPPPQDENHWRWNDQAQTYRPRNAYFDTDTAVVVEEFDHTCPWTGTAIGKRNMFPFQMFVCLVFVCLIVDIFLITGAL